MTRRRKEPTARELLHCIVEHESLAATCDEFPGLPEERARQILREFLAGLDTPRVSAAAKRRAEAAEARARQDLRVEIFTDGASRGNPGPAGAGWVIRAVEGTVLKEGNAFLGSRTNNEAEYEAVILGLRAAVDLGASDVALRSDSELLVKQINGQYRLRSGKLEGLHRTARGLMQEFRRFEIRHIPRHQNTAADAQANRALDEAAAGQVSA